MASSSNKAWLGLSGLVPWVAAAWLAGCAHMEAPPGGPTDTKKPYVSAVDPAPDALHISPELKARIAFSEWVDADVAHGKVYLNPPLASKLKTNLSGNLLTLSSKARLDTGTTYLLGVLGTVKDLHGLPLEGPFELVFGTGGKLDSGTLSGRVVPFQNRPTAGSFVALYPRGADLRLRFQHLNRKGDSAVIPAALPDPAKERPAYLTPSDSVGHFQFRSVRPGRYALLGFQDINANLNPDIGVEALAIGPTVEVSSSEESKTLALFAYDTVPVKMMEAKWVKESGEGKPIDGTVRLKFSRAIHPLLCQLRESYAVHKAGSKDSIVNGARIPVLEVCVHPVTGEVELHTAPLFADSQYVVSCVGLTDPYGHPLDSARSRAPFRVTGTADTAYPTMIFLGPRKVNGEPEKIGMDKLMPNRGLAIYFPKLLTDSVMANLKSRLVVKADSSPVSYTLLRANHHEFAIQMPSIKLAGQRLQFSLLPYRADTGNYRADTGKASPPVPFASYTLMDATKLGSLKFTTEPSAFGSRMVLRSLSSPAEFSRLVPSVQEFVWDSLPEGWYALDYFRDANGDGIWNPGSLTPWSVQEPYVMWTDSLEVKPKSVGDGNAVSGTDSTAVGVTATPIMHKRKKFSWPPSW